MRKQVKQIKDLLKVTQYASGKAGADPEQAQAECSPSSLPFLQWCTYEKAHLALELDFVFSVVCRAFASDQTRWRRPACMVIVGWDLGEKVEDVGVGCPCGLVVLAYS